MVVRVAGLAYQKGFGGHFHNDNAVGVLRDIPGIVVAVPARGDDAAAMLRTCLAAATSTARCAVFLEPIALYHSRDLHEPGDGGWLSPYPRPTAGPDAHVPIGRGRTTATGRDMTMVTFGNGVPMSLRVARRLAAEAARRAGARPALALAATGRGHAARRRPRPAGPRRRRDPRVRRRLEGVVTALVDAGYAGRIARVAATDSFIPLGDAANHVWSPRRRSRRPPKIYVPRHASLLRDPHGPLMSEW